MIASTSNAIHALRNAGRVGPLAVSQTRLGRGWLAVHVDDEAPRPLLVRTFRRTDAQSRAELTRDLVGNHALAWSRKLPVVSVHAGADQLWCAQRWVPGVPLDALLELARRSGGQMPREIAGALYFSALEAGHRCAPQAAVWDREAELSDYLVTGEGRVLHLAPHAAGIRAGDPALAQRLAEVSSLRFRRDGGIEAPVVEPSVLGDFVRSLAGAQLEAQEALAEEIALLEELPERAPAPVTAVPRATPTRRAWAIEAELRSGAVDAVLSEVVQVAHAELSRLDRRVDVETLVHDSAWDAGTVGFVEEALRQKARLVARE